MVDVGEDARAAVVFSDVLKRHEIGVALFCENYDNPFGPWVE
jgi:hypothetical protein